MKPRTSATVALLAVSVVLWPAVSAAQFDPFMPVPTPPVGPAQPAPETVVPLRGQTVTDRPRPLFDPLGLRIEEFFLYPRLELDEAFNDNIFATSTGTKGDFISSLRPRADLVSNFGQHGFTVSAGANIGWHASHSTENYQDAFTSVDGHYDIDQGRQILAGAEIDRLHVARTSPDFPGNAAAPPIYTTYGAHLGYTQNLLPVVYQGGLSVSRSEFQSVPAVGGGLVNQSDRNATTYTLALRGGYQLGPNYQVFTRATGNFRDYDHGASATNPRRNSAGYHVDAGAHVDFGVLFGEAYVGYLEQDYQNRIYRPIRGIDAGGKLVWNITGLTTLQFNAERTVQDISQEVFGAGFTSPGYLHSMVGLSVDHEVLRNLLLNARAAYINDDFKGVDRVDNGFDVGAGAKFLLRRDLYLGASYTYGHRDSSGMQAGSPYSQNIFMLRLATQL
jgi:hypothetical protein